MSSQEEQIQQRRSNLEALARLGVETYPHSFERQHTISALVDRYGPRDKAAGIQAQGSGDKPVVRPLGGL